MTSLRPLLAFLLILATLSVPNSGASLYDSGPLRAKDWICVQFLGGSQAASKDLIEFLSAAHDLALQSIFWSDQPTLNTRINKLLRSARFMKPQDRANVIEFVAQKYPEARTLINKDLRRLYDKVLKFTLPESTNFSTNAKRLGADAAYRAYLERLERFHGYKKDEAPWSYTRIRAMALELQKAMQKREGYHELLIGGSVPNGHGNFESDLDSIEWPLFFSYNNGQSTEYEKFKALLSYDYHQPREAQEVESLWKNLSVLNEIQPFALSIHPNGIDLIYFPPRIAPLGARLGSQRMRWL